MLFIQYILYIPKLLNLRVATFLPLQPFHGAPFHGAASIIEFLKKGKGKKNGHFEKNFEK